LNVDCFLFIFFFFFLFFFCFQIRAEEGLLRLYRGITAIVMGAIPSHAIHYATYEHLKNAMGGNEPGHHPVITGLAGGIATMAHDAVVTPLDVVKQRLQVYGSAYSGVAQCVRSIIKEEGIRSFYASYPTTVMMNVPFMTVHFAGYESFKLFFSNEKGEHGIVEELTAGGCAGALAGFVSTPFDVVKTRLQTQNLEFEPGTKHIRLGARQIIKEIISEAGYRGFMTGASARVLYYMPSAAICWTTYETVKRILKDAW
jgi:solute carrier family 25 iron transporter 28/37